MGPTQSAVAWPGCAEDKRNYEEDSLHRQGQGQAKPAMTTHQLVKLSDEELASKALHSSDTLHDDSHHVSVNPVYEFALCRKIKETFNTKGETSRQHSQTDLDKLSLSSSSSSSERKDGGGTCVVSVQPQSLAATCEEEPGVGGDVPRSPVAVVTKTEAEHPDLSQQGLSQHQQHPPPPPHTTNNETNPFQTPQPTQTATHQPQIEVTEPKPTTTTTHHHPNPHQVPTESKGTQTTLPHPGDISLWPPPPRPVMISVSTPPDETSPMFLTKLSPRDSCFLTDDVPSSPDVDPESDASDAGYAHLRGRFGSDGSGAGAAGAAAGACETPPGDGARRKRSKKKEEKSIDYVLRAMGNLRSPQEKLTALCKRYTELHEEQRGLQGLLKQHQRRMNVMQREKDQLQLEHNKAMMTKSKLESLCRELQKQNKVVKDESILRVKEEEDRRKQMSAKFQASIASIQAQVEENHLQNVELREENRKLSSRLRDFLDQHRQREEQLEQLGSTGRVELQLAQARLQQASAVLREEQEEHLKEKERILRQTAEGEKKNAVLEAELNKYKERYESFQETITKSGQVFNRLKSDMDRMGGRIKKLEKEGEQWKTKWERSNKTLQDVTEQKCQTERERQTLQTKVSTLESLCRALQTQLREATRASLTLSLTADTSDKTSFSPTSEEDMIPTSTPSTTPLHPLHHPHHNRLASTRCYRRGQFWCRRTLTTKK
ncbi:uncharacterized protein LOC143297808 [Babylonia areolata]|uniref:uncharacterized protein LOC143297808 n=1 Tax=Babylonia areolata TaxID=304850 RepID=UPI003FD3FAE0